MGQKFVNMYWQVGRTSPFLSSWLLWKVFGLECGLDLSGLACSLCLADIDGPDDWYLIV